MKQDQLQYYVSAENFREKESVAMTYSYTTPTLRGSSKDSKMSDLVDKLPITIVALSDLRPRTFR
jgi:hypothetical protein